MKKIMMAVAIVCAAVSANAAVVKWASGNVLMPDGKTKASSAVTASLYVLTAAEYNTLHNSFSEMTAAQAEQAIYKAVSAKTASQTSTTWSTKGANTLQQTGTFGEGDSVYGAMVYTTKVDDKDYYIANIGGFTFASGTDKTFTSMGLNLESTGAALSWQSVPEPTSGLLLLLGMAGLALRRRRA